MKKISILLPSRGRIEQTKASVESLFTLADDPTRFEICARIDSDDVESIKLYESGEKLKARCEALLKDAEARIEKIRLSAEGKPVGVEKLDE